jgi:hypothetical protein
LSEVNVGAYWSNMSLAVFEVKVEINVLLKTVYLKKTEA